MTLLNIIHTGIKADRSKAKKKVTALSESDLSLLEFRNNMIDSLRESRRIKRDALLKILKKRKRR